MCVEYRNQGVRPVDFDGIADGFDCVSWQGEKIHRVMSSLRQGPPARLLPAARPARNGRVLRLPPSQVINIFLQWGQVRH